ncbi:MAG: acyl transferase [Flavobacteriales bacterium]
MREPSHDIASNVHDAALIASINTDAEFDSLAKRLFDFQKEQNTVFHSYLQHISAGRSNGLPFLPIEAFKHEKVVCSDEYEIVFRSSGTTNSQHRSSHYVANAALYSSLSKTAFERLFGPLSDWTILALLPSYVEQGESSLVFMVHEFLSASQNPNSTFVDFDLDKLREHLMELKTIGAKTLLIGVSYALLDFAQLHAIDWHNLHVMETGGMKGRKKELTRSELHFALKQGFPSSPIHSEYGMTELLSQAYSLNEGWFIPPPWMKAKATDISDPLRQLGPGERGALAFIDLANVHSCCFIQTRDIGVVNDKGFFTVEGRIDQSDLRGCNLLYT